MICPRCGRQPPPGRTAWPFCTYCGRFLAPTRWVATPPRDPNAPPAPRAARRRQYLGPPRYREIPRWGFPALPWTGQHGQPGAPDSDDDGAKGPSSARVLAGSVTPLLWTTALLAGTSAGAEIWRYVLLLRSRQGALPAGHVAASDALVLGAGVVTLIIGACAGVLLVLWSMRVAHAAADLSGVRPSRSDRLIILGWVVPGLNLFVPGSLLAEVEHAALDRPVGLRPRPSRLLLIWWALWAGGIVLSTVTLLWGLRSGVQAQADGVVLHALVDLVAVATAVATVQVVSLLTELVMPERAVKRMRLVKVLPAAEGTGAGGTGAGDISAGDIAAGDIAAGELTPSPTAPAGRE